MYKRTTFFDPNYYKFVGSWAWMLHRLSGLGLIFYLSIHIWVINTLTYGESTFTRVTTFLGSPLFKLLEVGLWGIILFHAFNGVRVILVDFFRGTYVHKKLFYIMIGIAFILWVLGSYQLLAHIEW
ncbi:MAG: succinate dehydrogenase, cytochrome b556 subunit [Candidatus Omnitrophota bacterium]